MELQIKDLVDSIKHDGIEEANKKAQEIISQAEEKAASIIKDANEQSKKRIEETNKELEVLISNAKVTVQQAQRDAVLCFKKEIQKEFENILSNKIADGFDSKSLALLVKTAVADEDVSKYAVELKSVSDSLKSELADEIKKGLEIKPVKDIPYGFRLAAKDGSNYFDCTDEQLAKILEPFFGEMKI